MYNQQSIGEHANGGDEIVRDKGSNRQNGEVRVSTEGSQENKVIRMFRMGVGGFYVFEKLIV